MKKINANTTTNYQWLDFQPFEKNNTKEPVILNLRYLISLEALRFAAEVFD